MMQNDGALHTAEYAIRPIDKRERESRDCTVILPPFDMREIDATA